MNTHTTLFSCFSKCATLRWFYVDIFTRVMKL
nr:MAG TPA: hypothetical protein [Bacteriophage sp.]